MGGFHGTSNVEAGQLYDIMVKGTHAHAFVCAFSSFNDITQEMRIMEHAETKEKKDFIEIVKQYRTKIPNAKHANEGELAAFSVYALSFPSSFLALIDTYHTMKSGVINFICVALALYEMGYVPVGIRLDSGDLAYLSKQVRKYFISMEEQFERPISKLQICASSDISEATLYSLNQQGHEIDIFGIGTNLVTCSGCPALGCVYKLVSLNGQPRLKLSNAPSKITLPGRKHAYRLWGKDGMPVADIMVDANKEGPKKDEPVYCRHPFDETKRAYVKPSNVTSLHSLVWDGDIVEGAIIPISEARENLLKAVTEFRGDHLRSLNPTPYKVCLSADLYEMFHNLWLKEAPIEEIT